jgi:hypothetical protein
VVLSVEVIGWSFGEVVGGGRREIVTTLVTVGSERRVERMLEPC